MTKKINIELLNAAAYNPRKDLKPGDHEYDSLKRSIQEYGYIEPVVWNEQTGNVVGGHQRLKVLRELGETEIECVVVNFDEVKEKAANIALNKISGTWDDEKLEAVFRDLEASGYDLSYTGFSDVELEEFFKKDVSDIEDDDFDLDAAIEEIDEPVTQKGDLWLLGPHRLMCGDSTKRPDIFALMDGKLADIVFTDPPYNVNYSGKSNDLKTKKIKNDQMDENKFLEFLTRAFSHMADIMRPGAVYYICHPDSSSMFFREALVAAELKLAQTLIWRKNNFVMGRQDYQWQHEPILYGWKEGAAHYFTKDRTQSTIWDFDKPTKSDLHPTMKPVPLVANALLNSSKRRDNVVDLFAGSGTTLMAAEELNQTCFLMEIDPIFCDVIVKRWEGKTGQKSERIAGESQNATN